MEFPVTRLRRLRRTEAMRSLVREVHLRPEAFIYPLFICPAVSRDAAGANRVALSDMMEGGVGAIRDHLDDAGLEQVRILSSAAKFSSAFSGPFREAADSAPQFGDRRTYQMDGANLREAM